MTIKSLEYNILSLGVNPGYVSHATYILKEKYNQIALLKKKLKIPAIEPVHLLELRQEHEESENNYENMDHLHKLAE